MSALTTINQFLFGKFIGGRVGVGLLLLRLITGLAFILHGWGKIQHPFNWMGEKSDMLGILQALAALSEFGGGIALILGLLMPLATFGIACTMVVAANTHIQRGDPFVGKGGSYELAAVYLVIAVLLFLTGPGKFSLDALLFGGKQKHDS